MSNNKPGTFIGHLTPALPEEERLKGEGFSAQELKQIYTAPGWGISMYSEHESDKRPIGKITRTWFNEERGWLDVEAAFSLLHPDSVNAYQSALRGELYLSPSFQHPKPGSTDPASYYNCLCEVSVTRDPYRKGAVMVSCHNSNGASVTHYKGSLKLVPNKCGADSSSTVVSAHRRTPTAMASAPTATVPPTASSNAPSLDEIKASIINKNGEPSDEALRAYVAKNGVPNAPSIKELLRDSFDFSDLEKARQCLSDPEWKLTTVAQAVHTMLNAKGKKTENADSDSAEKAPEEDGAESLFKKFYQEHQRANLTKVSEAVKGLLSDEQFKRAMTQLEAIANQPQFYDVTSAMTALAACAQASAAPAKASAPSATHQAPTISAHSAARSKPVNPTDQGIQSALELLKNEAKRRNEQIYDEPVVPPTKAPVNGSGYVPPRFVPKIE